MPEHGPPSASLDWTERGPRSQAFGDIYYSLEDGLAESRAVFLAGCGLPEAWAGRDRFCVAELGFGTGLNIVALLHLWRRTRPPEARLNIFSIEAYPVAREDAARALGAWPELAEEAAALLQQWPGLRRGFHRITLPEFGAVLDLAVMPVDAALARWSGAADAWFLDGFAPSANPDMWSADVLNAIAAHSAPGAVCATFTVAGSVRRGLEAAGFAVSKKPGHGRKRERLEARLPGRPARATSPRVAMVGAGVAGAALARALRAEGVEPAIFDSDEAAASGNPAALVTPGLDAGDPVRARLYAEAFARAVDLYRATPGAVITHGVLRVAASEKEAARFDVIARQDIFEPGRVRRTTDGLMFEDGLVVDPAAVLAAWSGATTPGRVVAVERGTQAWVLRLSDGRCEAADVVILAAGWGNAALAPGLALAPVRGQVSWNADAQSPAPIVSGAYAIPMRQGVLFGATHDRGVVETDLRIADHQRNLAALAEGLPTLALVLRSEALEGRAAVRATTPDRLPIAGALAPGLYVLGGLGSHGFATAPLLAEHIAADIAGAPSPLAVDLAARVDPARPILARGQPAVDR